MAYRFCRNSIFDGFVTPIFPNNRQGELILLLDFKILSLVCNCNWMTVEWSNWYLVVGRCISFVLPGFPNFLKLLETSTWLLLVVECQPMYITIPCMVHMVLRMPCSHWVLQGLLIVL